MLRRLALVRADVSGELSASFIRVTRIGKLVTASVVTSSPILVTLMMATRRNIPEDAILHSHRRENLKSGTKGVDIVIQPSSDHGTARTTDEPSMQWIRRSVKRATSVVDHASPYGAEVKNKWRLYFTSPYVFVV
jgi:hypothetical protein